MSIIEDTLLLRPVNGVPTGTCYLMEHDHIERIAGVPPGSYAKDPVTIYIKMLHNIGTDILDQYIPTNPLTMGAHGYESGSFNATTGGRIVLDGMVIDSPEAVVDHLEHYEFPRLEEHIEAFSEEKRVRDIIEEEHDIQAQIGCEILKTGYGFVTFPYLSYTTYGYQDYFMAFALYPEVMERHFSLQADLAILNNKAAARAYREGNLPPLYRLDHDMADSRGTLVNIKDLDKIWFPHFARSLEPMLKTNVRMIWHCDGNLSQMVPRLIDVGIKGFQGFQYEDGMDYEKICKLKTKEHEGLIIWAGVSVTRTLPSGSPEDVKKEIKWLVENGPTAGLILSTSSSAVPGIPWENIKTMIEGLQYYRNHR